MSPFDFQQQLESSSGKKLELTFNDNVSTMVSVKWQPDRTKVRVSLHRMFLNAPENVMQSLACYIDRRQKTIAPPVKAFISENLKHLDYSNRLKNSSLQKQGSVYDLGKMYDELNNEYFDNTLRLNITWFGKRNLTSRSIITFGYYCETLKLIKISWLLDAPFFPDYVVAYIIYHEMLHHVFPPYIDEKGTNRIHNREFKNRERAFKHYRRAKEWIKSNKAALFATA